MTRNKPVTLLTCRGFIYETNGDMMIIETKRLVLRPWRETDAESLYEYAKDPTVGPAAGWSVHTSVENSREVIKNVLSDDECYAVCLKGDDRPIGSVALMSPVRTEAVVGKNDFEVGYWVGVPFWGNGYIPEALQMLLRRAFTELGSDTVWCAYYDGNEKSKKCMEKCGFVYHHTEYEKPVPMLNEMRTEHFTRITKEQWIQMQAQK